MNGICVITRKGHNIDAQNPNVYEIDAAERLASWGLVEHDVCLPNREQNEVFHPLKTPSTLYTEIYAHTYVGVL